MTWIFGRPDRPLLKAILLPSGDQAGSKSKATSLVSRLMSEPSALQMHSSGLPSRVLTQRTLEPSRDYRGDSSKALCGITFFWSVPSELIVSICSFPSVPCRMSRTKTTFFPSGDQWASKFGVSAATRR